MHYFGAIIGGVMIMNEAGKMVEKCIKEIPLYFPYTDIDYYCIMPNHIHVIIIIKECMDDVTKKECRGEVTSPLRPKLGNIIAFFKYNVTKKINAIRKTPGIPIFQRYYYKHIIRNDDDLYQHRNYIQLNPMNWDFDENNLINIKVLK